MTPNGSFNPVVAVARVMRGYRHPWFVSGGWAIDLFVGRVTREHEDIEIGAFFPHQDALRRHLAGWELARIRNDAAEPWAAGDPIELPEFLPGIGPLDDIVVAAVILRWVGRRAGPDRLRELWPGTPEGFALVARLLRLPT